MAGPLSIGRPIVAEWALTAEIRVPNGSIGIGGRDTSLGDCVSRSSTVLSPVSCAAVAVAAVGCNRRGENNVKAPDSRRPGRRRTPEELAQDHEDALRWRSKLRAEAGSAPHIAAPPPTISKAKSQLSRFAVAIARAEFGRFYFK